MKLWNLISGKFVLDVQKLSAFSCSPKILLESGLCRNKATRKVELQIKHKFWKKNIRCVGKIFFSSQEFLFFLHFGELHPWRKWEHKSTSRCEAFKINQKYHCDAVECARLFDIHVFNMIPPYMHATPRAYLFLKGQST